MTKDDCIFCRIKALQKKVDQLPDSEEVEAIKEDLCQLKEDVEKLSLGLVQEHEH